MTSTTKPYRDFDSALSFLQSQLLSRSLLALLAIAILGLSHALATGWKAIYYTHLIIAVFTLATWLAKDKLTPRLVAVGLITLVCSYAASSLLGLGLATAGLPVFFAAAVICLLLFSQHKKSLMAALAIVMIVFSGVLFKQLTTQQNSLTVNIGQYIGWAAVVISSLLFLPVIADYVSGMRTVMDQHIHKSQKQTEPVQPQYDPLTGLPLLTLTMDRLQREIHRAKRNGTLGAVMFIDVDDFLGINGRYGIEGGNRVLRTLAARISSIIRASDTLCRIGGDTFVAIFADQKNDEQVRLIAHKLLATVSNPITFKQDAIDIKVSIGVSVFPEHSVRPQELLQLASETMEQVKNNGGNHYRVVSSEL